MTIVSSPESRFPKKDLTLWWNFQHGRCIPNGVDFYDMAPAGVSYSYGGATYGIGATMVGGPVYEATPTSVTGGAPLVGAGIHFDGSNDYCSFEAHSRIEPLNAPNSKEITQMMWLKYDSWRNSNPMTFGSRQSATWWQLDYNSQDRYAYGQGFSQQYYANWPRVVTDQAGVTLDVGNDVLDRWYCMTFVVNTGANVGCFIDGVVAPEFDSFEISFAGPMGYGGASTIKIGHGADGYFDGTIGMICQWMRSLTDREVLQAYNATKGYFAK